VQVGRALQALVEWGRRVVVRGVAHVATPPAGDVRCTTRSLGSGGVGTTGAEGTGAGWPVTTVADDLRPVEPAPSAR
jgi:hypothetical protein